MKKFMLCVFALLVTALMLMPAMAGDDEGDKPEKPEGKGKHCRKHKGPGPRLHIIAKLLGLTKEDILDEFDEDGDGKLSREEMKAAHEALHERIVEKYDEDGDGELSEEERAEMHEDIKELMKDDEGKPERGKGPKRGRGGRGGHGPGGGGCPGGNK
ncbi:MAG: EF-hand domain-containing protein [Planctomycetota bacterium]|jgi:hypothetical protein